MINKKESKTLQLVAYNIHNGYYGQSNQVSIKKI